MKENSVDKFPYQARQKNGSEQLSEHKTFAAAKKAAIKRTKHWKGARIYGVWDREKKAFID